MIKKIQNFTEKCIQSPYPLFLGWSFFLISPIWDVIRFFFLSSSFFNGQGIRLFLSIILLTTKYAILPVCVLLLFKWFNNYSNKRIPFRQRLVLFFIVLTGVFTMAVNTLLLHFEAQRYPNFIYSHIGITADSLLLTNKIILGMFFLLMIVLYQKYQFFFQKKVGKKTLYSKEASQALLRKALFFVALIVCLLSSLSTLLDTQKILNHSKMSYEQKLGPEYKYVAVLVTNTPQDAQVIHPPQTADWPFFGNQPMIRYFLFPRTLISGVLLKNQEFAKGIGSAVFAQIENNPVLKTWPEIDPQQQLITFDQEHPLHYQQLSKIATENGISLFKVTFYE